MNPPTTNIAHRIYFSDLAGVRPGTALLIGDDEANHAVRAKRLRPGETVAVFNARGTVATATVLRADSGKRPLLELALGELTTEPPTSPRVEIWCPPPKGDRLEGLIDQLSQLGVAAWRPLRTIRAERDTFRQEKLERVAIESAKQCARAWAIEIGESLTLAEALADPRAAVADASGESVPAATTDTALLLGPEGGFTPEEMEQAHAAGRSVWRLGVHVMRIETAAVAGAARLLAEAGNNAANSPEHPVTTGANR